MQRSNSGPSWGNILTSSLAVPSGVATFVMEQGAEFPAAIPPHVSLNRVSDSTSTEYQAHSFFFHGEGLYSSWTHHPEGRKASVSVSLIGGAFLEASRKLREIRSEGLESSSSMETSGAVISAELACVYALDKSGTDRLAARHMMVFLESKLRSHSLIEANRLLVNADVSQLSSRSMIGMIRSTFRIKKDLPYWSKAYAKSWKRVSEIGKNPKELFIGLPSVEEVELASTAK